MQKQIIFLSDQDHEILSLLVDFATNHKIEFTEFIQSRYIEDENELNPTELIELVTKYFANIEKVMT